MSKEFELSIVLFRRDLRLEDNTAFIHAVERSKTILPCFIFDERQVGSGNEYRSQNAIQFMVESLQDLRSQLRSHNSQLFLFSGLAHEVVAHLLDETSAAAVFVNEDYTPFSKKRDEKLADVCHSHDCEFISCFDTLLTRPGEVLSGDGNPYQVYTYFKKKARREHQVARPKDMPSFSTYQKSVSFANDGLLKQVMPSKNPDILEQGGRKEALKLLEQMGNFGDYYDTRNFPANKQSTTRLSPHHKFGTISVRESYYAIVESLGYDSGLINELYWRDFYTHVAHHYPEVFGEEFMTKFKGMGWDGSDVHLNAWKRGETGFPIVDAGMRQLNKTGWMHNRVRMIVASFLTKDLRVDWREGEKYFAQQLIDYDPCVNNGSWQWAASTGTDAQPYFRIFNPWSQQKKYDPDAIYIKRFIPELASLDAKQIHSLAEQRPEGLDYPEPIVDHSVERKKTLEKFKEY